MPVLDLTAENLQSIHSLNGFFHKNKAVLGQGGVHFDAFDVDGSIKLIPKSDVLAGFQAAKLNKVTDQLITYIVNLLQTSPVKDAVENPQKHGTYLPPYLYWLGLIDETLHLKFTPSAPALWYTLALAAGQQIEQRPVYIRLFVDTPSGTVNREQLEFVLNFFAESAQHHFKCFYRGFGVSNVFGASELVFRKASNDKPYCISLIDAYFSIFLCKSNIDHEMKQLEKVSDPLVIDNNNLLLPHYGEYDEACIEPEKTLPFGLVVLPKDKLKAHSDYRLVLPCSHISEHRLSIALNIRGNTFPYMETHSPYEIRWYQVAKLRLSQSSTTAFIPSIKQLFVVKANATEAGSAILHAFHKYPDQLHLLSQKSFAHWFLETPVKDVNVAMLSLLRRVQEKEAFTLPASAQIVTVIQCFIGYLKSFSNVDEAMIKSHLKEEGSLPLLRKLRPILLSISPNAEVATLNSNLGILYQACRLLPFKDKCIEATKILEEHFKVALSNGFHNLSYPSYPVAFLITRFLHELTRLYKYACNNDDFLEEKASFCETLICKGMLPLFMLQDEVEVALLNKSIALPVELVGVSFDFINKHDGTTYTPATFWPHDYLAHGFSINSIIDTYWKMIQNADRVTVMHNIETVRAYLSNNQDVNFTFIDESIAAKQLLMIFDLLYFVLAHESSRDSAGRARTQTNMRLLPSAFPHTFLEKVHRCFSSDTPKDPTELLLEHTFGDFTDDMLALFPLIGNSSFPFLLGYMLLDAIVEQTRNAKPQGGEVSSDILFAAFEAKLAAQEKLIYLYEQNWERLVEENILYPECAKITSSAERHRALALPNFQERLRSAVIDWKLEKESLQAS